MKKSLGMTPEQVINHNLKFMIAMAIGVFAVAYLTKKVHPIKIAIVIALFFIVAFPFIPYWINNTLNLFSVFCLQYLLVSFTFPIGGTLDAIQYKYFPIGKRFTIMAATFGVVNPFSKILVVFSLIPLTHYFGYYALWFVFTPVVVGYLWALYYFRKLEIERGLYFDYPCEEKLAYPDTALEDKFNYNLSDEYKPFMNPCQYSTALLNQLEELNKKAKRKINTR